MIDTTTVLVVVDQPAPFGAAPLVAWEVGCSAALAGDPGVLRLSCCGNIGTPAV